MIKQSSMVRPNGKAGFHLTELAWGVLIVVCLMCWILAGAVLSNYSVDIEAIGYTLRPDHVTLNVGVGQ